MSVVEDKGETKTNSDGKNLSAISCEFCSSKILNPGTATLVNYEFPLPHMRCRDESKVVDTEDVTEYWLVEDIYTFENILVSNTANQVKYLACADCEKGPVGWHDIPTKKSYIALCRVRHA